MESKSRVQRRLAEFNKNLKDSNQRVKFLREVNSIKKKDLAHEFGYSVNSITNFESEGKFIPTEAIIMYVEKFGISSDWILFGRLD